MDMAHKPVCVEDVVDVWHYAVLSGMPETMITMPSAWTGGPPVSLRKPFEWDISLQPECQPPASKQ